MHEEYMPDRSQVTEPQHSNSVKFADVYYIGSLLIVKMEKHRSVRPTIHLLSSTSTSSSAYTNEHIGINARLVNSPETLKYVDKRITYEDAIRCVEGLYDEKGPIIIRKS